MWQLFMGLNVFTMHNILGLKVTKVSCNEKFSVQVKGKQPKDFKKLKKIYFIS